MTKPDDIPQDVWDASVKCAGTVLRNLPDDYGDVTYEIHDIARAIMAAKAEAYEDAAKVADERVWTDEDLERGFDTYSMGSSDCAKSVASAIRSKA